MNFDLICYITFSVILALNEIMYGLISTHISLNFACKELIIKFHIMLYKLPWSFHNVKWCTVIANVIAYFRISDESEKLFLLWFIQVSLIIIYFLIFFLWEHTILAYYSISFKLLLVNLMNFYLFCMVYSSVRLFELPV